MGFEIKMTTRIWILLAFALTLFCLPAAGQTVEDSSRRTIGYISTSGTVEDEPADVGFYIGVVEDSSRRTSDISARTARSRTLAADDRLYRSSGLRTEPPTIGHVTSSGVVEDTREGRSAMPKASNEWAAAFFSSFRPAD